MAAGEGRLESDELEQRVHRALRARTYGDLSVLVADLPGEVAPRRRRPLWRRRPLAASVLLGIGLVVAMIVALALVALVAILMVATAAWWIGFVLVWAVCFGSRRRRLRGPAWRRYMSGRHPRRARPSGLY